MTWQTALRKEFPVTNRCIYLDAAYDCGGSKIGKTAAARYFDDWAVAASTAQRGGPGREIFFRVAEQTRAQISTLLCGVETKNISFTKNTNEGFNSILNGFDFKEGDNIVTFRKEYPSIVMPCVKVAETKGIECRLIPQTEKELPSVDTIWDSVDDHTVMILISHVRSETGYKIDLQELGRRCREKGIFLIVDAVQSMGLEKLPVEEWGISAVSAATYKNLGGFISVGFIYICDELLRHIQPTYVSHNFQLSLDLSEEKPVIRCSDPLNASKLDNCSSDYLGIYVMHDALEQINKIGIEKINKHVSALFNLLYAGLKKLGYSIITPEDADRHCASIALDSANSKEIVQYFYDNGVVISGSRIARFSLAAFNNRGDVEKALEIAARCPYR